MTMNEEQKLPVGKLAWGLVLLIVGAVAFLDGIDLWDSGMIWTYWPVLLIALGLAGEIDAIRRRRGDGSYIGLAVGVWMLAGTKHFLGWSVGQAFPLAIIIAGLCLTLHAIIDVPNKADAKENINDQQ